MKKIYHEVVIGATAEEIYSALTIEKGLSAWWTQETRANKEPGSVSRFTFANGYYKEMKIVKLKPFEEVEWKCISGATEWIGTTLSFRLFAHNKESFLTIHPEAEDQFNQLQSSSSITLLSFEHNNWKEYTSMFAECNYTWGRFLRSLKLYCETGQGLPWPKQHKI